MCAAATAQPVTAARVTAAAAVATAYPFSVGDAACYCAWRKTLGYFADNDPTVGCKAFYWCYASGSSYNNCQTGAMFNEKLTACDWPTNTGKQNPGCARPSCIGDAFCFCTWKGQLGMFADQAAGCSYYFWCVGPNEYYYKACQPNLLFNDNIKACDWPANVKCAPAPSPPPAPPSPPPSPPSSPPPPSPPPSPPLPPSPPGPPYLYGGYYESWSDAWRSSAANSRLATLPSYVNAVYISFMQPDATYTGGATWSGTGIQFSSDASVVKGAIALLKQKNPRTKVLVAVGGATYTNWAGMNTASIAKFVQEFGLDGVDIDYEPTSAGCAFPPAVAAVKCAIDAEFIDVVTKLRAALPRPYLLSSAVWSIGAYGQGAWVNSQPQGDHTGQSVNMLKAVGDKLDILNVMSYDASNAFNAKEAYDAYRSLFKGQILMGVEVPPEAWGGHVITVPEAQDLTAYVMAHGGDGMMIWSLQKSGTPSAQTLSTTICNTLGMGSCSDPLFP
ncbi:hypothetical protein ABPG75_004797 [Micractinium tetrahymenae]